MGGRAAVRVEHLLVVVQALVGQGVGARDLHNTTPVTGDHGTTHGTAKGRECMDVENVIDG